MFKVRHVLCVRSQWLFVACFLTLGIAALIVAPAPFVQHVYATGESCGPENACPDGGFCCNGVCQVCPCPVP